MSLSNSLKTYIHLDRRYVRRTVLLTAWLMTMVLGVGFHSLWHQRFNIIEHKIITQLAQDGVRAELSIVEFSQNHVSFKQVKMSDSEDVFFKADSVDLAYQITGGPNFQLKSVEISNAQISLTLDEAARPTLGFWDDITRQKSEELPFLSWRPEIVKLKDSKLFIQSPYGNVDTVIDGELYSQNSFNIKMDVQSADLSYGDSQAKFSGALDVVMENDTPFVSLNLNAPSIFYKEFMLEASNIKAQTHVNIHESGLDVHGQLEVAFTAFHGSKVESEQGNLTWRGELYLPRKSGGVSNATGDWAITMDDLSIPDLSYRKDIANRITLADSLSKTPIMADFAKPISSQIHNLLGGTYLSASGKIRKTDDITQLFFTEDLVLKSSDNSESLSIIADIKDPVYVFDRLQEEIKLNFDANLEAPLALKLQDSRLVFHSATGRDLLGLKSFDSYSQIHKAWQVRDVQGRDVRLRPMSARINYKNNDNGRRLDLSGKIHYDGAIPGGYTKGLIADGHVSVHMEDKGNQIYFTPVENTKIYMTDFDMGTMWLARHVNFTMSSDPDHPIYKTDQTGAKLETQIRDVQTELYTRDGLSALELNYGYADLSANILEMSQDWSVNAHNIVMTSDTMPSEGTDMRASYANMRFQLDGLNGPQSDLNFTFAAPLADVKTQMIEGVGLAINAAGQADKFRIDYENGQVKFRAGELPPLSMSGFVIYENQGWHGGADSLLPFGAATPMNIDYRFENGRGFANVNIPEMKFSPWGVQPQMFIPALKGKVAEVDGVVKAQMKVEFGLNEPMRSSGSAQLINMNLATLPGPITGINSELRFSSFFPLVTDGLQTLSMTSFDPGFPLQNGEVSFEAVADGIKIHKAQWPLGNGIVSLDPGDWLYLAPENRMSLRIDNVNVGEFLGDLGGENFSVTGQVNGVLPVVISGVNVEVENGKLAVKDGGVIQYKSRQTDMAGEENKIAQFAFDALKELYYKEMEALLNGPLDGTMILRMLFDGTNPNVLGGTVFRFNVKLEGELLNIARSFKIDSRILEDYRHLINDDMLE